MLMPVDEEARGATGTASSTTRRAYRPGTPAASLAALGLHELAASRILVLRREATRAACIAERLAAAGFVNVEVLRDSDELLAALEARSDGHRCDIDLLLVDEHLLSAADCRLGRLLHERPAFRRIALLALLPDIVTLPDLRAHARLPTLTDLVDGGNIEALLTRTVAALRQRHDVEFRARAGDVVDAIIVAIDTDGRIRDINRAGCELLGRAPHELLGHDWFSLCIPNDELAERGREYAAALAADGDTVTSGEGRVRTAQGEHRMVAWRHSPWRAPDGRLLGLLCCGHDITDRNRIHEQLRWHASHDLLTGLLNRSELENRLSRVLEEVRDGHARHALAYLDIDQFKVINDACGFEAGDELLRRLGALLPEQLRPGDVVARLGGDQFAVLMFNCPLAEARRCTRAIADAIEAFRFLWQGRAHRVGASVGLVAIDSDSGPDASVLGAADAACHAAKQRGGSRIHVYEPDDAELVARQGEMQWVLRINRALDDNRFQLWMQPIRRVNSGEQDHGELLLRMLDEDGALVMPATFLPAAERFHLSTRIDRWVVKNAFRWLGGDDPRTVALRLCCINLSGLSLSDEAFLDFTVSELRRHGIAGERVCFEITETAAIGNLSGAIRFIRALKEEGVRFALDDFGSGLSSFAYLKTLPVDYLKIDGVFVKDIADNPIDYAMVKSIHEVARVMGKETVGEYVETGPVFDRLREIGVHYAQGYAVGRPFRLIAAQD